MATAVGLRMVGKHGSSWVQNRDGTMKKKVVERNGFRVSCSYSHRPSSVMDSYKTLRIDPSASEAEVKKAFRKLALQYHPDVCRGSNSGVQFHLINEAYHAVMSKLRRRSNDSESYDEGASGPIRGTDGPDWELWEEWMGWEGAGIRDYSSHINPYI